MVLRRMKGVVGTQWNSTELCFYESERFWGMAEVLLVRGWLVPSTEAAGGEPLANGIQEK